jgi:hypothetical protein
VAYGNVEISAQQFSLKVLLRNTSRKLDSSGKEMFMFDVFIPVAGLYSSRPALFATATTTASAA